MSQYDVTIIIPTLASSERAHNLYRAIDCVLSQADVNAVPMVVVNGNRFDETVVQELSRRQDIIYFYRENGSAPEAQLYGRLNVETPYFGFLDDDDEILENGLANRLDALCSHPTWDVVVSSGFVKSGDNESLFAGHIEKLLEDPLRSIVRFNWMASCSALFRTETVPPSYFEDYSPYVEWTLLGLKLALSKKIGFLNKPTYRINATPGSVSTSEAYRLGIVCAIEKMMELPLPLDVRLELSKKRACAMHELSKYYGVKNTRKMAWIYHLKSLFLGGWYGLRFLTYTRHLLK